MNKRKLHWLTILVHVGALLPLASLAWDYAHDQFLVDRVREITTRTGRLALTFLLGPWGWVLAVILPLVYHKHRQAVERRAEQYRAESGRARKRPPDSKEA